MSYAYKAWIKLHTTHDVNQLHAAF